MGDKSNELAHRTYPPYIEKSGSYRILQMHSNTKFQLKGITLHIVIISIVSTTGIV